MIQLSVYICAPSELVEQARRIAGLFERAGVEVTSNWLKQESLKQSDFSDAANASFAIGDLQDISRAKMFIAINPEDWRHKGTGGRHVELGYALAIGKPVVLYGDKTNVFHFHPLVYHVEDPGDLIKATIKRFRDIQP